MAICARVFAYSFSAETALDLSGKRRKRLFSACSRSRVAPGSSLCLSCGGTALGKAHFCNIDLIRWQVQILWYTRQRTK